MVCNTSEKAISAAVITIDQVRVTGFLQVGNDLFGVAGPPVSREVTDGTPSLCRRCRASRAGSEDLCAASVKRGCFCEHAFQAYTVTRHPHV